MSVVEVLVLAQHDHQVPLVPDQGLVFRSYAAAACHAARTASVCSGVGCVLEPLEMRAVMGTRRSWVSMSSKAGSVLAWYQGWARRRAVMRPGLWPCRACQV